jgi:hypothetical protein
MLARTSKQAGGKQNNLTGFPAGRLLCLPPACLQVLAEIIS